MRRMLMVASVDGHIKAFHLPYIALWNDNGFAVDVAARVMEKGKAVPGAAKQFDLPFARSPWRLSHLKVYRQLKQVIDNTQYDCIHCHTPVAAILTRLAARKARKQGTKVYYTAHGFHFFKGAPLLNWLVYYPAERMMACFTDKLITINREDYARAKTFRAGRVAYVPGMGVDVTKFADHKADKDAVRRAMDVPTDATLLLSVGELNRNKNHQVVIRALAKLQDPKVHYAIAGEGKWETKLKALASELGIARQVHLLGYRSDVADLYQAANIFCFPSKREGLALAGVEAMAAGLPIVSSTTRGGILDYSESIKGGFALKHDDVSGFAQSIKELCNQLPLRKEMGEYNKRAAWAFDIARVMPLMAEIYSLQEKRKCDT